MSHWHDCKEQPPIAYSAEEAREMDRWLADERGFSVSRLMDAAGARLGAAVLELVAERSLQRVVYMVGPGHNGGDALVARSATAEQLAGEVWQPLADGRLPRLDEQTLLVDGLFGVGLSKPLNGAARVAVELVLGSDAYVLAVDVPSGLCAGTGAVLGVALRADRTLTFVGPKQGFFVGAGPAHVGLWQAVEIGFPVAEAEAWVTSRREQEV